MSEVPMDKPNKTEQAIINDPDLTSNSKNVLLIAYSAIAGSNHYFRVGQRGAIETLYPMALQQPRINSARKKPVRKKPGPKPKASK